MRNLTLSLSTLIAVLVAIASVGGPQASASSGLLPDERRVVLADAETEAIAEAADPDERSPDIGPAANLTPPLAIWLPALRCANAHGDFGTTVGRRAERLPRTRGPPA
ncbi:MAG: hypothetical protein CMJ31_11655 [Phycisphaerae bacterium]|nr:hypothetical protein [Phycisphaerae bacterium]